MGIFANLLANADAIDVSLPISGIDAHARQQMLHYQGIMDPEPSGVYAAADEVQSLAANASSSGNFTLTFTLQNGETFTTGNIAFDDSAATIEGAIDTAATSASITGWTNGDISVSGGDANTNPTVFTFDGDSVTNQNHGLIVATDVDLNDGTPGVISVTTEGRPNRDALQAMAHLGEMTGTPPAYRAAYSSGLEKGDPRRPNRPSQSLIKALLDEISFQEQQDYHTVYNNL